MVTPTHIGRRIRALRQLRNMTQRELADRSGISEATVLGRIERGQQVPRLNTAAALADALGVGLDELVADDFAADPRFRNPTQNSRDELEQRLAALTRCLSDRRLSHLVGLLDR